MNKGVRFADEFKPNAVVQVVVRGYAVSEVTKERTILKNPQAIKI